MTRSNHARASRGAACRKQARPSWVRPFRRARRALGASVLLIESTLRTITESERCGQQRPVRTSLDLNAAFGRLAHASTRLGQAMRELARTNECWAREVGPEAGLPELFIDAATLSLRIAAWLRHVADDIHTLQSGVLEGLETGAFLPEPGAFRPRITAVPRPAPVRAFLRARLPRLRDRITPILQRRRRTPRPAGLRVPRRSVLGRAPPLSPVCPR